MSGRKIRFGQWYSFDAVVKRQGSVKRKYQQQDLRLSTYVGWSIHSPNESLQGRYSVYYNSTHLSGGVRLNDSPTGQASNDYDYRDHNNRG